MASRFTNSPVFTRLRNSPVISAAKKWASGKSSPKPLPKDPNPRRYNMSAQATTTASTTANLVHNGELEDRANDSKMVKFARNASPRLKKMGEGFMEALKGGFAALMNPKVLQDYAFFLRSMGSVLIVMYACFAVLWIIYLPIFAFALAWAPGLLGQILTMIPLWAFIVAKKRMPMSANRLFLDELERLSPSRAQELSQQMRVDEILNPNWTEEVTHDMRTSWHFTKYSLMFLAFSIVPVVGSFITYLGQTWLVADRMGWNLLSVYTISAKHMSYRQQKHWMRARKWRIIGFTLPYMFLSSIPFIGPLILGIAQAATAHIYFHLLSKDNDSATDKNKPSASPVEFKRPV